MFRRLTSLLLIGTPLLLMGTPARAEEVSRTYAAVVHDYVSLALASNLALKGQSYDVERQLAALAEARSRFFPQLALEARYTRSRGGRSVSLPLGSLVNPAYQTLNELLVAQGQPPRFENVSDPAFTFLREREQDTRLTVRQPIYAPAIPASLRAQRELLGSVRYARLALARRIERDVRVGYLDWLRAGSRIAIADSSLATLAENLRVTQSLYANGRITRDQVLRAEAELLEVRQVARDARNDEVQTRYFVNFLLNRELAAPLEVAVPVTPVAAPTTPLPDLQAAALARRPELDDIERQRRAAEAQIRAARAAARPQLALAVDAGYEGTEYRFNSDNDFSQASLLLTWSVFDGGAIRARVNQARAVARRAEASRDELALSIQLEVRQALDSLETAVDSLATAQARAAAARAAFQIAARKRDEGAIAQVEFIDVRSALTAAEENLNATGFDVLARGADLDFVTASAELPAEFGEQ